MTFGVVELGQIVEVIWVSLVAGVGITTSFSFVVFGLARYVDSRGTARVAYAGVAVLAFTVFLAGMIFGVQVMLTKGG